MALPASPWRCSKSARATWSGCCATAKSISCWRARRRTGRRSTARRWRPVARCSRCRKDTELAGREGVSLAELDGKRLLAWSPAGTPYTDLLVARLAGRGSFRRRRRSADHGQRRLDRARRTRRRRARARGWPPAGGASCRCPCSRK
jgi:hypothetical protein